MTQEVLTGSARLARIAQDACASQSACNPLGLAHSLIADLRALRGLAEDEKITSDEERALRQARARLLAYRIGVLLCGYCYDQAPRGNDAGGSAWDKDYALCDKARQEAV